MTEPSETWLVLALQPQLLLAISPTEPGDDLGVQGVQFRSDPDAGAVTAFYDRILNDAGSFVGIRVWPTAEDVHTFVARIPRRTYIRISPDESYFDVYFEGPPYPNASSEGDQAFGGRFYFSRDGQVALSLDLSYLGRTASDLRAVRGATVRWTELFP